MKRLLTALVFFAAIACDAQASSRSADLDYWFDHDLVPYVTQQLATLPRFKDESFRFVVMNADSPRSEGSRLAIDLRDRLRDAIANLPGVRVAWQADQPGVGLVAGSTGLDCTKNDADYFIGIELQETTPGQARVLVRALDIEERTWVAGFSRSWRGPVTSRQRRLLRESSADPTFRGERDAPWDDSQADLMAAHLAYELGCELLRQTAGEYVVAGKNLEGDLDSTQALVELVSNNLAGIRALQFGNGEANSVIEGKAHRIDDDLFQYWITIRPTENTTGMTALSADAYVRIPDKYRAAALVPEAVYQLQKPADAFLAAFGIVRLFDQRACLARPPRFTTQSGAGLRSGDCFALQVRSSDDAVLFFLNHQLNNGLVRLANENCSQRSMAKIARTNEAVKLALPLDSMHSGDWTPADDWLLNPPAETYHVLAATDTKAARALSKHIESLPKRCSASVRRGVEGDALRRWIEELGAISNHWAPAIDWQSIRVKEVY